MKDDPFLERIVLPHAIRKKRAIGMYHITGFGHDEMIDLCILINSAERAPGTMKWPPILGELCKTLFEEIESDGGAER